MIKRTIEQVLADLAGRYPVVTITGPRQSGKTTLCRAAFPTLKYANLEAPDVRRYAIDDPRGQPGLFQRAAPSGQGRRNRSADCRRGDLRGKRISEAKRYFRLSFDKVGGTIFPARHGIDPSQNEEKNRSIAPVPLPFGVSYDIVPKPTVKKLNNWGLVP